MIARNADAHRLWIAMWSRADEGGVFRADPRRLAVAVLGIVCEREVARLLAELEKAQLIDTCPRRRWRGVQLRNRAGMPRPSSTHPGTQRKGE